MQKARDLIRKKMNELEKQLVYKHETLVSMKEGIEYMCKEIEELETEFEECHEAIKRLS